VIHFDTNALIPLPQWAREGRDVIHRVLGGCCGLFGGLARVPVGPAGGYEAELAYAFLAGRIEPFGETDAVLGVESFTMPPAVAGR
jgi:hypothetical protein